MDDYIAITFTVSTPVRSVAYHRPESLSALDFYVKYRFSKEAKLKNGTPQSQDLVRKCKAAAFIPPGDTMRTEFDAAEGWLLGFDDLSLTSTWVEVKGQKTAEAQRLRIALRDGNMEPAPASVSSGRVALEVENLTGKRGSIFLIGLPPNYQDEVPKHFSPFLQAKRLFSTQTFRDLFRAETIKENESLSIKDITILFTDLKGSTALYDRIGDLKAFALVRQHFDSLGKSIAQNSGAIVKTIGDAVMATFLNPLEGIKAALSMLLEIAAFNREIGSKDMILKIGLHQGAAIAVTLNDRLDYFGQTVNIAARVQGLADGEEICVTQNVYEYAGVQEVLSRFKVEPRKAKLKGVGEEMQVYRIR